MNCSFMTNSACKGFVFPWSLFEGNEENEVTELRYVFILKERLKARGYERHCTYTRERSSSNGWSVRRKGKLTKRVRE